LRPRPDGSLLPPWRRKRKEGGRKLGKRRGEEKSDAPEQSICALIRREGGRWGRAEGEKREKKGGRESPAFPLSKRRGNRTGGDDPSYSAAQEEKRKNERGKEPSKKKEKEGGGLDVEGPVVSVRHA